MTFRAGAVTAVLTATLLASTAATAVSAPAAPRGDGVGVLRVSTSSPAKTAARLQAAGFDLVESRIGNDLLVVGDSAVRSRLARMGYRSTLQASAPRTERPVRTAGLAAATATFYGGYKTADEYVQHLSDVAAARPDLAVTHDVGDSWRKTQGLATGNDLVAICLTKQQPGDCTLSPTSTKPRFLLIGAVHARELSATELSNRFVDYLADGYGTDAEVTSLLDSTEVWVVPVGNPDGREIVEQGTTSPYLQRKNANNSLGACAVPPTSTNQHGIDLNRNYTWKWGGTGTSTNPCDATFRGSSAGSEPETVALSQLMTTLYPDQRGPLLTDAAPLTTPGYMLTLHSYANMHVIPWGDTTTKAPNDTGLRSAAFRASYYNGYQTGQPGQILYTVTGSTDDYLYGERGVAASTMEVGPNSGTCTGFTPAYSCQDGFWTANKPAMLYLAKAARAPYQLSLGPTTSAVTAPSTTVPAGSTFTLTATGNDNAYGSSGVGRPTAQTVNAGRYFVDTAPWAGGAAVAMTANDGSWNATSEVAKATVPTTGLTSGRHQLWVQTRDNAGNWGPATSVFVTVG